MNAVKKEFCAVHFRARTVVAADPKVCSGCKTCEIIWSLTHEGAVDLSRSRIYVKSNPFRGSFIPMVCRQCTDAPCYYACPEKDKALCIDSKTGARYINKDECTGCGSCVEACPMDVGRINFDEDSSKAIKCDLCKDRKGGPVCVEVCDKGTLTLVS